MNLLLTATILELVALGVVTTSQISSLYVAFITSSFIILGLPLGWHFTKIVWRRFG